jgi:hypothetical protein
MGEFTYLLCPGTRMPGKTQNNKLYNFKKLISFSTKCQGMKKINLRTPFLNNKIKKAEQ